MACGTGFCAGKIIAGIIAVGLGGFGAYNYAKTGCILGSCSDEKIALTEASTTTDDKGCCPLTGASIVEVAGAGCSAPCTDEMKAACTEAKLECAGAAACSEAKTECTDKAVACSDQAAVIEAAATSQCATACAEKTACSNKKDCGGCDPANCSGPCGEVATKNTEKSDG